MFTKEVVDDDNDDDDDDMMTMTRMPPPQAGCCLAGDMMRKSIVYNPKTPDVFYCPLYKPKSFDDMLVKSRPLSKLCEFKGRPLPADYKSDCYGDVDETEFACAEKHRILVRG